MNKTQPRKSIIATTVLERAAELFADKGFAGTSLQDIADAVGMSRPALYYYFESKNAVLEALIEDVTVNAAETLLEHSETDGLTPGARLKRALEAYVLWILQRPALFRITDRAEGHLPAKLAKRHDRAKRQVLKIMVGLVEDGVTAGEFRPVDPRIAALSLIGMCNWSAWWFSPSGKNTVAEIARMLAESGLRLIQREALHRPDDDTVAAAIELLRQDLDHLERLAATDAGRSRAGGSAAGTKTKPSRS